jgi:PhnB protein
MAVKPVPDGYHTVTPYLIVDDVALEIDFLQRAFGAVKTYSHGDPGGNIRHAEVRIGDSMIMMGQARDEWHAQPVMLYLYVPDVDATYKQALQAGATSVQQPADQPYGDRSGGVADGQGNQWWIATHIEDVSPQEIERRYSAMAKKQAASAGTDKSK